MNSRVAVNYQNGNTLFSIRKLSADTWLGGFSCRIAEYNDYLFKDALRSQRGTVQQKPQDGQHEEGPLQLGGWAFIRVLGLDK